MAASGQHAELQCYTDDAQAIRWSVPLPTRDILNINRDMQDRIWITYPGTTSREGKVGVWTSDGRLIKTMTTRGRPEACLVFTHDRGFILCALNGFGGAVDVVDMDRLELVATWPVPPPEPRMAYLLTACAISADNLLISGMTLGPDDNRRYAILSLFDLKTGERMWQSPPMEGVDIWSILTYRDGFLMLNVASDESDENPPADLIFMDANRRLERWSVARAPLWGTLQGDTLFLYHNPAWNSLRDTGWRLISRTDLRNHLVEVLPLPDYFKILDMLQVDNSIFLSNETSVGQDAGVYRLAWADRRITHIRRVPGMVRMR